MSKLTLSIIALVLMAGAPLVASGPAVLEPGEVRIKTAADAAGLPDDTKAVYLLHTVANAEVLSALAERKLPDLRSLRITFSLSSKRHADASHYEALADFEGIESLKVQMMWSPADNFYDHIAGWTSLKTLVYRIE